MVLVGKFLITNSFFLSPISLSRFSTFSKFSLDRLRISRILCTSALFSLFIVVSYDHFYLCGISRDDSSFIFKMALDSHPSADPWIWRSRELVFLINNSLIF